MNDSKSQSHYYSELPKETAIQECIELPNEKHQGANSHNQYNHYNNDYNQNTDSWNQGNYNQEQFKRQHYEYNQNPNQQFSKPNEPVSKGVLIIVAIFIPPLAVFLKYGCGNEVCINVIFCTLFLGLFGIIHAIAMVCKD